MASCDEQATTSDENLDEETADVEKVESKVDSNEVETRTTKNGLEPQPTKIPGPVSNIHISNRKYSSLMKLVRSRNDQNDSFSSTSTLVNTAEDSGIQMDCSTVDDDNASSCTPIRPSSSTPRLQGSTETIGTIGSNGSLKEFEAAEQQTLKVLQRAVAEMEADVALHAKILEEQIKLDLEHQLKVEIEEQVEIGKNRLLEAVKHKQEPDVEEEEKKKKIQQQMEPTTSIPHVYERKHVLVEDLLQAKDEMQLLQNLLETDGDVDNNGEKAALAELNDETLLLQLNVGSDVEILGRLNDKVAECNRKQVGFLNSILEVICSKGIRKLSFPILFCGMAVGLIYYFRKD